MFDEKRIASNMAATGCSRLQAITNIRAQEFVSARRGTQLADRLHQRYGQRGA